MEVWSAGNAQQVQACKHGGAGGDAFCLLGHLVEEVVFFSGRGEGAKADPPQRNFRETDVESSQKLKGQAAEEDVSNLIRLEQFS